MIAVTITGRLGADPETRALPDGTIVLELRIASNNMKKDQKESTTWVRASMFGSRAEKVAAFLRKGERICVTGTLEAREYEHQGAMRTSLDVRVSDIDLIADRSEQDRGEPARPAPQQQQSSARASTGRIPF